MIRERWRKKDTSGIQWSVDEFQCVLRRLVVADIQAGILALRNAIPSLQSQSLEFQHLSYHSGLQCS
jgi:hypothetical protein